MSDIWLPVLGTVLACCAAGSGFLLLLDWRAQHRAEALGLAFLCGAAWLAVVVMLLGFAGAVATAPVLLTAAALPYVAGALKRKRVLPTSDDGWGGLAMGACLVLFLLSAWFASARPVWNVDAQTRWVLHGQWLAETATIVPGFLAEEEWIATHPTYPPLVPALVGLDLLLGADRDFGVRPLFPFFLLAMLAVIHGAGRRHAGRLADWVVVAFGFTPILLYIERSRSGGGTGADAALADLPLTAFVTAMTACFLAPAATARRATWLLAMVLGAGAVLTKQEGVPMVGLTWMAVGLLLVWRAKQPLAGRHWLASGLGILLVTVLWRLLVKNLPIESGEDYLSLDRVGAIGEGFTRLGDVAGRVGADLLSLEVWGPLWWSVPVAAAVLLARRADLRRIGGLRPATMLLSLIAAHSALVIAAYLVSGWRNGDYERLMNVSLSRLLLHHGGLVPLLWVVAGSQKPEFTLSQTDPE